MAFVILTDGTTKTVTADQGKAIWEVLNGDKEPNEKQGEFCNKVKRIYLNPRAAPKSYLKHYPPKLNGDEDNEAAGRLPYKD